MLKNVSMLTVLNFGVFMMKFNQMNYNPSKTTELDFYFIENESNYYEIMDIDRKIHFIIKKS